MYAALGGHIQTVQVLLAKNADVNARDINGESALSLAAREGKPCNGPLKLDTL